MEGFIHTLRTSSPSYYCPAVPRVTLVLVDLALLGIKPADHAPHMTQTIAEPYHKSQMTKAFYFLHVLFESPLIYLRTLFK